MTAVPADRKVGAPQPKEVTPRLRYLQRGEPAPEGTPRRYKASSGYVRLRWNDVGPGQLVECWEHRYVMGFPDAHVHHINGVRDDNRPENLEILSPSDHGAEHRDIDSAACDALHRGGMSVKAIARQVGHDNAAVMRAMKRDGFKVRTLNEAAALRRIELDLETITKLMRLGVSDRRIANAYGVTHSVIRDRRRLLGITPRRDGRVTNAEGQMMDRLIAEMVR